MNNEISKVRNYIIIQWPNTLRQTRFPQADANASYDDRFLRYKNLTNITSNHKGKFTRKDMIDTLWAV